MAFQFSNQTRIAVNGLSQTAYTKGVDVSRSVDTADVTTLADTAKAAIPGLASGKVAFKGLFDPTPDAAAATLLANATNAVVQVAPAGFALGNPVYACQAVTTDYQIGSAVGDAVNADFSVVSNGNLDYGYALHDLTAETATGNGAAFDGGASSSNGGVAYLNVTAVSGAGASATVVVQGSSNGTSGWAAVATFTAATSTGAQRVAVSGSVARYLRATWTVAGSTPSITFTVSFARR